MPTFLLESREPKVPPPIGEGIEPLQARRQSRKSTRGSHRPCAPTSGRSGAALVATLEGVIFTSVTEAGTEVTLRTGAGALNSKIRQMIRIAPSI